MNERFQNALKGKAQAIPPVWFMRQAGRYHKHYQNLKKTYTFMQLCKQPKLAAEVALGPVLDFDFDVSILFSDLLFPLEAMGMGLTYDPGPKLAWSLTESKLKDLRRADKAIDDLRFQKEAMIETRKVLPKDKSLIGFVGGPWTLFTYAAEGEHKGSLKTAKTGFPLFHGFCEILMPLLQQNIQLQLEGGAEVVMVFDTAAGELSPGIFHQEIEPLILKLARQFPGKIGYYSKGTTNAHIAQLRTHPEFAGFGVDHRFEISEELVKHKQGFLQGNFDQALLFTPQNRFRAVLDDYLKPLLQLSQEQRRFWVSGLGHGVLPETPEDNVRTFVQTIREAFAR